MRRWASGFRFEPSGGVGMERRHFHQEECQKRMLTRTGSAATMKPVTCSSRAYPDQGVRRGGSSDVDSHRCAAG